MGAIKKQSYEALLAAAKYCEGKQLEAARAIVNAYQYYKANTLGLSTDEMMEKINNATELAKILNELEGLINGLEQCIGRWVN